MHNHGRSVTLDQAKGSFKSQLANYPSRYYTERYVSGLHYSLGNVNTILPVKFVEDLENLDTNSIPSDAFKERYINIQS